jgi:MFS family permease
MNPDSLQPQTGMWTFLWAATALLGTWFALHSAEILKRSDENATAPVWSLAILHGSVAVFLLSFLRSLRFALLSNTPIKHILFVGILVGFSFLWALSWTALSHMSHSLLRIALVFTETPLVFLFIVGGIVGIYITFFPFIYHLLFTKDFSKATASFFLGNNPMSFYFLEVSILLGLIFGAVFLLFRSKTQTRFPWVPVAIFGAMVGLGLLASLVAGSAQEWQSKTSATGLLVAIICALAATPFFLTKPEKRHLSIASTILMLVTTVVFVVLLFSVVHTVRMAPAKDDDARVVSPLVIVTRGILGFGPMVIGPLLLIVGIIFLTRSGASIESVLARHRVDAIEMYGRGIAITSAGLLFLILAVVNWVFRRPVTMHFSR